MDEVSSPVLWDCFCEPFPSESVLKSHPCVPRQLRKAIEDTNAGMLPAQAPTTVGGTGAGEGLGDVKDALLGDRQQGTECGSDSDDRHHLTVTSVDSALSSNASESPPSVTRR